MLGASCWDGPDMAVRMESQPNCCEELSKTKNKMDEHVQGRLPSNGWLVEGHKF